jgi:hypothetical protein
MRYGAMGWARRWMRIAAAVLACEVAGCRDAPPIDASEPAANEAGAVESDSGSLPDADINASLDLGVSAEPSREEGPTPNPSRLRDGS